MFVEPKQCSTMHSTHILCGLCSVEAHPHIMEHLDIRHNPNMIRMFPSQLQTMNFFVLSNSLSMMPKIVFVKPWYPL